MKPIKPYIAMLLAAPLLLTACSDTWDEHYGEPDQGSGTQSLLQLLKADSRLTDFCSLLDATHVYNNQHSTSVTFSELVDGDQALTVWAPVNGTFNIDSLLQLCQTAKGDSTVGQHFVMNHLAHNLYNMNAQTSESVKMLNDKFLDLSANALYDAKVIDGSYNQPAKNGLLHVVDNDAAYTYNIYEGIMSLARYRHLGQFLSLYEKQELDENLSIVAGLEDGKKVYSDSVMVRENALFRVFDQIMCEDSNFVMLAPDAATWQQAYDEALPYFNYGSIEKADSVARYWTNVSLLRDLIINKSVQRSERDSVFTTSYYRDWRWPYHVYYEPYKAGGLLDPANIVDSLQCSNGKVYGLRQWPFTPQQLYYRPINVQGEREASIVDKTECTYNFREVNADSVSANGYMDIVPNNSSSNWTITYEVPGTLSGAYDIYAVIQPKTVYLVNSRDFKPNKFKATLFYVDLDGETKSVNYATEMKNDGVHTDSVLIGRFTFPTCNFQQPNPTVRLKLECSIGRRETQYSREMYLDCILLKPVTATASEAEERKEAMK